MTSTIHWTGPLDQEIYNGKVVTVRESFELILRDDGSLARIVIKHDLSPIPSEPVFVEVEYP